MAFEMGTEIYPRWKRDIQDRKWQRTGKENRKPWKHGIKNKVEKKPSGWCYKCKVKKNEATERKAPTNDVWARKKGM